MPPQLPQELIIQILRECVPSWSLTLVKAPTLRFDGYPQTKNLQLISRLFNDSVKGDILARFTGEIDARIPKLPDKKIYEALCRLPQAIWDRVTILHHKHCHVDDATHLHQIFKIPMPALQLVTFVYAPWTYDNDATTAEVLAGGLDDSVISYVKHWLNREDDTSHKAFMLNSWLERGAKIRSEIDMRLIEERARVHVAMIFEIRAPDDIVILQRLPASLMAYRYGEFDESTPIERPAGSRFGKFVDRSGHGLFWPFLKTWEPHVWQTLSIWDPIWDGVYETTPGTMHISRTIFPQSRADTTTSILDHGTDSTAHRDATLK